MFNQMVEHSAAAANAVYRALAHPIRRDLVDRLSRVGERGTRVTDLAAPYSMSLAAISKHLRVLEESGLVRRSIVGRDHFLALQPQPLDEAMAWMARCRTFWNQRLDRLESLIRSAKT